MKSTISGQTDNVRDRLVVEETAYSWDDLEPRTERAVAEAMAVSLRAGRWKTHSVRLPSPASLRSAGRRAVLAWEPELSGTSVDRDWAQSYHNR